MGHAEIFFARGAYIILSKNLGGGRIVDFL